MNVEDFRARAERTKDSLANGNDAEKQAALAAFATAAVEEFVCALMRIADVLETVSNEDAAELAGDANG